MLNTVKDVLSTLGDGTSHAARRFGSSTADLARYVGANSADIARAVGSNSATLARRVGPKRGLLGLVVLGAAIGGSIYLLRYLRARREEMTVEAEAAPTRKPAKNGSRKEAHLTH